MSLEIEKVLIIAGTHVPPSFFDRLDGLATMHGEFGWLVWSKIIFDDGADPYEAAAFRDVLGFAVGQGAKYVLFDCDAEELPGFRVWGDHG